MPTPVSSLTIDNGSNVTVELDGFAADLTDLGPDLDSAAAVSSDTGVVTVAPGDAPAQFVLTATGLGSATVNGSDGSGRTATLSVSVVAPPAPAVASIGFVSLT